MTMDEFFKKNKAEYWIAIMLFMNRIPVLWKVFSLSLANVSVLRFM